MSIYTPVTVSNYNSNPPDDNGSEVSSNEVEWAKHKTKIGDPLKTAIESINTNLTSSFDKVFLNSNGSISTNTNLGASDHGDLKTVTNSPTISLAAANTLGAGWHCTLIMGGDGTATIDPNGSETINGAETITVTGSHDWIIVYCDGSNFYALTKPVLTILDEDDFASDSDSAAASQQSIKAYVDMNTAPLKGVQTFSSSGTYTPTSGTATAIVFVKGAGGGGGGGSNTTTGSNGGNGGASSFSGFTVTITANGGTGGQAGKTTSEPGANGSNGSASGGDANLAGGTGHGGAGGLSATSGSTGGGGSGGNGAKAVDVVAITTGTASVTVGAAGSGGSGSGTFAKNGQSGSPGYVEIWEFG